MLHCDSGDGEGMASSVSDEDHRFCDAAHKTQRTTEVQDSWTSSSVRMLLNVSCNEVH